MERGVSLSGGEKQRLALARGLFAAKKSDIILMDEPTSSVDSLNETKIHEQVFEEFKEKTIISSIHKLHLLDKFDYIYLFSKGKIIAQGTFEELKNNPHFKAMWIKYNKEKKKITDTEKENPKIK
ncbi:MAG: ABC transporter ATP-binding protein [archaeon]|nr:ABC transporter ATP-binding protein [archaeon]